MMKTKIRIQKIFVLLFMVFAVFNYNNCELSNNKTTKLIDEGENNPIENDDVNTTDSVSKPKLASVTSIDRYNILLETYTGSNLHDELKTCGNCHKGNHSGGAHGENDAEKSLNDLLFYFSSSFNTTGKVNFDNPLESVIYKKALEEHNGANAENILIYIKEWINSIEQKMKEFDQSTDETIDTNILGADSSSENDFSSQKLSEIQISTEEITLPINNGLIDLNISDIGKLTIEFQYDSVQKLYILKNPTISLTSESKILINEPRAIINGEIQKRYGTWSSVNQIFNDGDIIGNGSFFIEAVNPGQDKLKFGFVEFSNE